MITQWVRRAALVLSVSAAVSLHASGTIDVRAVSSNVRYDTTESDTQNNWSS